MFRKIIIVILSVISLSFLSCSNEEINTDVSITGSTRPLIPGTTASCYSLKTKGSDQPPVQDVMADYYNIPTVTLSRAKPNWQLVIFTIRLTVTVPTMNQPVVCTYAGDNLLALDSRWWGNTEAIVPVGQGTLTNPWITNCAIKCGGINTGNQPFVASGQMEVFGAERNPTDSNEELPVKLQTFFTVQSY